MNPSPLPLEIASELEAIRNATGGMMRAAVEGNPVGLRHFVEARGGAVRRLATALEKHRPRLFPEQEQCLRELSEFLSRQAEEAERVLKQALEEARAALGEIGRSALAIRGYAVLSDPGSLDRSG